MRQSKMTDKMKQREKFSDTWKGQKEKESDTDNIRKQDVNVRRRWTERDKEAIFDTDID